MWYNSAQRHLRVGEQFDARRLDSRLAESAAERPSLKNTQQ
jgi:hypothetical protein